MQLLAIASIALGYLLGSIPTGLIISQRMGVNIRKIGSGKTGATNVMRSAGLGAGLIVALGDVMKGMIPVLLARFVLATPAHLGIVASQWVLAATGLAAIAGHNYPVYVGFRGGRGVATTGGIAIALNPPAALIAAIFFVAPIARTRYVSLGSMVGGMALPLVDFVLVATNHDLGGAGYPGVVAMLIAGVAIVASHRDNIERLRAGTERRLGDKATPSAATR